MFPSWTQEMVGLPRGNTRQRWVDPLDIQIQLAQTGANSMKAVVMRRESVSSTASLGLQVTRGKGSLTYSCSRTHRQQGLRTRTLHLC